MTHDLQPIFNALDRHVPAAAPAAQLCVYHRGAPILNVARGVLDPAAGTRPVTAATRFDLASVTKLFVVTAFMRLVEQGAVTLDQPVATVLPAFIGVRPILPYEDPLTPGALVDVAPAGGQVDAATVTFHHLLTHTSGLPAWRPLFREPDAAAAHRLALTTFFSYPPGTRIVYSDIGLILLGMAVEALRGQPLDAAVRDLVLTPLGLDATAYRRAAIVDDDTCAPTELCGWRGRRVVGAVHDENAFYLGGVAGHAGLFSTAPDVARFGQSFLNALHGHAETALLRADTVTAMVQPHAVAGTVRRGLGFALWSPDPEASGNPFSTHAFGHTGFTGTSLWIDPARDLVVALLTNEVYNGRAARTLVPLRLDVHRAVLHVLEPDAP